MSIEAALYAHLAADAGLAAVVSTRIYPMQLPQQPTLPALTYQRISTLPTQHRGNAIALHRRVRMQIDCWAADYDTTLTVRAAVLAAMNSLAQDSGPRIDVAQLAEDRDVIDPLTARWRASIDFFIWYEE